MLGTQAGGLGGEPRTELGRMDDRSPTHERLDVEVRIADQVSRQCPEPSGREPRPPRPRGRPRNIEALQLLIGAGRRHDLDLEAVP